MAGHPVLPSSGEAAARRSSFRASIDHELTERLQFRVDTAPSDRLSVLWQRVSEAMQGGKRSRPDLVDLGFRTFGGHQDPTMVSIGCAVEMLHTAFVLHDDVIDRDFIRRGRPTLSAQYRDDAVAAGQCSHDADHVGHSAAVLAGDLLLAESIRIVHEAVTDHPASSALIDAFHRAVRCSAAGELDDVLFAAGVDAPDIDSVLEMHRLKTAAYSFEAPLRMGALLAGARINEADQLAEVGAHLGIGYQIIDDVLGTFGDPEASGKPVDSDLRERKFTVLIALLHDVPEAEPVMSSWRAGAENIDEMRAALTSYRIESRARMIAQLCCDRARRGLDALELGDGVRAEYEAVMDHLQSRGA